MKCEVKKYDPSNQKIEIIFKETNSAFMNALRKYILSSVPTMAIDEVTFYKNGSGMYDEMIALRLGLLPLKTDLDSYILPEKCECTDKTCAKCSVEVFAKKKGPGILYAKDLEFSDPGVKPVYPMMEIVKLDVNQEIEFTGYARLGTGKKHAKYSPGFCYYRNLVQIETKKLDKELSEKIISMCPGKVFDENLNPKYKENCDICNKCVELSEDAIKVIPLEDQFVFYLESFGQLDIKRILREGLKALIEDLKEFEEII
ncbi:MAG: DNA-directed RNA polymerase subunit D [Candidatus Woesearchaeota archaeon]